jgi:polyhydroxybutyrate depolymerase
MDFNGSTRHYILSKPKTFDAGKKYPLVLNLHGNPALPQNEKDVLPFDTVTKQEAVIAYPGAANGSDWDFSLPDDGNPDMPFIKALIDELATKASIDPDNVLGFGYSGGAYFLSQYACRVGGVLKMVAIVSGGAPEPHPGDQQRDDDCVICPGGAVPMFIAHGMNDQTEVPFEGGDYARICWAETNGCNADDLTDVEAPCKKYNGCDQPLTWCPVPNQDHAAWVPSMQRAWDMFKSLP